MHEEASWVEVIIQPGRGDDELLRGLVGEFGERDEVQSWHFFREPELYVRFLTTQPTRLSLELADYLKGLGVAYRFGGYKGEQGYYGEEGFSVAVDYFACGARTALKVLLFEPSRVEFHVRRYVHLFLNQLGYTPQEEVELFHRWAESYRRYLENRGR